MYPLSRRGFIQAACTSAVAITSRGNAFESLVPQGARQPARTADTSLKDAVVSGKFGTALNAAWTGAESAQALASYKTFPFTVEFWCKLDPSPLFYNFIWTHNTLVANEPQESADHWALYLEPLDSTGTPPTMTYGALSAYWPGMDPEVIKSSKAIADGQWHYIAMVADGRSVALYVDGKEEVSLQVCRKAGGTAIPGKLTVGKTNLAMGGTLDFNGAIDDLRLSNVARDIRGIPATALRADAHTIGLWSFDYVEGAVEFVDVSSNSNPMQVSVGESLDEIERAGYKAGPSPLDSHAHVVSLKAGAAALPAVSSTFSLDGKWQLVEGATAAAKNPMTAVVPGSVHTALYEAGVIPFPYHGRNQEIAAVWSQRTFWYQKTFPRPPAGQDRTLIFDGICNRCTVWLNGKELGQHEGMFTRVEFPIHDLLQENSVLVVKLDPAIDWKKTLVPNIFYGPFYTQIPPLGIWRSVEIRGEPSVKVRAPFIATRDAKTGLMDLVATLAGATNGWGGRLLGVISPENFSGQPYAFEYSVTSAAAEHDVHLQFNIPEPQLWWPVDIGKPNLYRLTLAFLPSNGGDPDVQQETFGIRTVQMAPLNGKPRPRMYNWTFVINGKPVFVKGTNWCTPDALMDFSRSRYERLLTMAARQHIQMLRAWGYGIVETDDFYDLCDRLGLMVMQEWPTTWNSHNEQPFKLLEETVRENTVRLRNHPSLVMYTGGNESTLPFGPAIDMMGRLNVELDGTRAFHRGEPRGGATHDYTEGRGLDEAFTTQAMFYGEVGYSFSYPNYESVERLLPADEENLWPAPSDGVLAYKTRVINSSDDWNQMLRDAQYFTAGQTMERFIVGTQLAQAVGVRHILERARTRWPECTGALYFKFNEIAPTAERTTVDWYGSPKIPYYLVQDSLAPLLAVTLFPKATTHGEPLALPVFLLDDANALEGAKWEVTLRVYGADLKPIKNSRFAGSGSIKRLAKLGELTLTAEQTKTAPLLVVTDVKRNGKLAKRNYYFTNFAPIKDCLFDLPKTTVSVQRGDRQLIVRNEGKLPAVGVNASRPGHGDTFFAEENYFWLNPGEAKNLVVSTTEGVVVQGWNL
jgi:beta-mannosidase